MSDKLPLLDRCPFCGGKAILSADKHYNIYSVWCDECCAGTSNYGEEKDAIDAWNSRVQLTFTPDELDVIRRMFDGPYPRAHKLPEIEQSIIDKCNHALARSEK